MGWPPPPLVSTHRTFVSKPRIDPGPSPFLGDSRSLSVGDILGEPHSLTPETLHDPLPVHQLRRDTAALEAAQRRMEAYCRELLRASCIASGIGDPKTDISDLLTIKIQERAVDAGLWMEASKAIVLDSLRQADSKIGRHFLEAPRVAVLVAEEKAKEFFRREPEGEHVAHLTTLLTFIGFPPPPTVGDAIVKAFGEIDARRQADDERLARKEQDALERMPGEHGAKATVAWLGFWGLLGAGVSEAGMVSTDFVITVVSMTIPFLAAIWVLEKRKMLDKR